MKFIAYMVIFFGRMGFFVFFLSGLVCFIFNFKKRHYLILIGLSMLAGYLYTIVRDISDLGSFAAILNGLLTILAIGLIKLMSYLKVDRSIPSE